MKEVAIIYHNHLDPEWARCYERPMVRNSVMLKSYSDVWDFIIDTWLDMADEGYRYTEGQGLVWRTYLSRHPEKKDRIKELVKKRGLEILLQGELTPETNYSPAEGLARNYLLAKNFYAEFCGENYAGTKKAWIWDAFGNSANMPQILKLAGAEMVGGTKYRPCPDDFWVGIDGTKIPCIDNKFVTNRLRPDTQAHYGLARHIHCPECGGFGCAACNNRGLKAVHTFHEDEVADFFRSLAKFDKPLVFGLIGGEEVLPNPCVLSAMKKVNGEFAGKVKFRFGDLSEYWEQNKQYYADAESRYTEPSVDLNPVHQGCYVTRIENKQKTRALTYALVQAEALVAADLWKAGKLAVPPGDFTLAWRNLLLNMHHDSISGAHIDAGQAELMDYLDECESIIGNYAPRRKKYRANRIGADKSGAGVCEKNLGKMKITFDKRGIVSILKDGRDLFGEFNYKNMTYTRNSSDRVRIGELLLQCDWGDNHNAYLLGDYVLLGSYNYSVYEGSDFIWWRGRHEAADPGVKLLQWEIRVQASPDGERLDFVTEINWDTSNKRIRVVVPVNDTASRSSVWEIPYGFITRAYDPASAPPFGLEHQTLASRSIGEYPALHWVRHDIDERGGVAILNKGIPSVKWIPGCFEVSLLRSPMMTGDTVLPSVDEIWDVDGTRDAGRHLFEYSIWPFTKSLPPGDLTRAGYRYNDASPEVPFRVEGDVVVTAFKPAEDGTGFIFRVQEAGGRGSKMALSFDSPKNVSPVNLMEVPLGAAREGSRYEYELRKHEILTLLIQPENF